MATFDSLVPEAMPYLATETLAGVAGASWEWGYRVNIDDDPVDFTGCTGTLELKTRGSATVIIAATVTFPAAGEIKCTATPSATNAVAAGSYLHELVVTNAAGRKVVIVGAGGSQFIVKDGVTA